MTPSSEHVTPEEGQRILDADYTPRMAPVPKETPDGLTMPMRRKGDGSNGGPYSELSLREPGQAFLNAWRAYRSNETPANRVVVTEEIRALARLAGLL